MTNFVFYNSYESTTATALTVSGTSVDVDDAGSLTTPAATEELRLTLVDPLDSTTYEIIKCTVVAGVVLTIARGQEGTTGLVWPIGTVISARLTAEMLDGMAAGFDNDGDAKGAGAVNLQPGRSSAANVASGIYAIAAGQNSRAEGSYSVAIGRNTEAVGTSGIAIGNSSSALGSKSVAIGYYCEAKDERQVIIGFAAQSVAARDTSFSVNINSGKRNVAKYTKSVGGFDYIAQHDGSYTGAADGALTFLNGASETVIYSDPVNLGSSPSWLASTSYEHGAVIFPTTPNGKCYLCYEWDGSYFASGTSGSTEPTWPTTAGNLVTDNAIQWICIDPADYQMTMPDYLRFIPTEVGFIGDVISDTTQPFISFGINGNLTKWLASTQTTKLTGDYSMDSFAPTNNEGAKQFGAGIVTAGVGNYTGRFYWKGIVTEILSA